MDQACFLTVAASIGLGALYLFRNKINQVLASLAMRLKPTEPAPEITVEFNTPIEIKVVELRPPKSAEPVKSKKRDYKIL